MVARRTAEREGGALTAIDQAGGRQRHVVGGLDRIPRALDEGRAAIEGIEAELRIDGLRPDVAAQAARRPGEGHAPMPDRPLFSHSGQTVGRKSM